MKKILFFVLIAIIACSEIKEYELENTEDIALVLKGIDVAKLWNKFKNNVSQAKQFLKSIGLYYPLINLLKQGTSVVAIGYCTSQGVPYIICTSIVEFLMSLI